MSNYGNPESYQLDHFTLDITPYVTRELNPHEAGVAVQYGADFRVRFSRQGSHEHKLGLIQLILPRTQLFAHTVVGEWNIDKQYPDDDTAIVLEQCLYGSDGVRIGTHSATYAGQEMRQLGESECWLIDTPREINGNFEGGVFTGLTNTKFANYVVELDGPIGRIFNTGLTWGYSVQQDGNQPVRFDMHVLEPRPIRLKDHNEHLAAISSFLNVPKGKIAELIH
ncbi:hypothetical protein [Zoogloea sp. LCSB751]|uniref:hypothetical protein n=1 Tax=Zoogloea sp. LCSB751 TaxID=1965277 RepID=UPI0009A4D905|nr:hypothetical protein [Zoogloea sp. LCSB751]